MQVEILSYKVRLWRLAHLRPDVEGQVPKQDLNIIKPQKET